MSGIIYEPRALWSVQSVTPSTTNPAVVRFPRAHFRNGWRHPITLTRMLIAPVGYLLQEYEGANEPPTADTDRHDCGAAVQVCSLLVRAPQRQLYTLNDLLSGAFSPMPAEDISMRDARSFGYAHALMGLCRWNFERPCELPADYAIDFRLGGALLQPQDIAVGTSPPEASVAFFERGVGSDDPGSSWRNNARVFDGALTWRNNIANGNFPFPPDGLGAVQTPTTSTGAPWPYAFTPSAFRRLQESRTGPTTLTGFAVGIDHVGWETAVQASAIANVAGSRIASLALRTPTLCKIVDAGSQAYWWREGAPLALVSPSLTPASVYELQRPITLHKGDTLEVELETPGAFNAGGEIGLINPTYQIGVSFTGYAAVEG